MGQQLYPFTAPSPFAAEPGTAVVSSDYRRALAVVLPLALPAALVDRGALVVSDTEVAYRELMPRQPTVVSTLSNRLDRGQPGPVRLQ